MSKTIPSGEQANMVHVKYDPDHSAIPREVFLSFASPQTRKREIQQNMFNLIEDSIMGDASRVEAIIAQICPKKKVELEVMAHVIVSKALDEPQYCKACVSLSGALRMLLPALPTIQQGQKTETFLHALLDVFQTEFEELFMASSAQNINLANQGAFSNLPENQDMGHWAIEKNNNRIRAIVHFAAHLYCQGLLGNGVVQQMVQDLVDTGYPESANELLWAIGVLKDNEERNLGTVLEDDGDGASSESISTSERRPSKP